MYLHYLTRLVLLLLSKFINNHGIDVVVLFGGEVTIAHSEFINNNAVEVVGIGHSTRPLLTMNSSATMLWEWW